MEAHSTMCAMVRDNTTQRVMLETLEAWEGRNSFNTCPNGANEEYIGIYTKSSC